MGAGLSTWRGGVIDGPDPMIPVIPDDLDGERSVGPVQLRYEDIVQDGRLSLLALPQGFGQVVWPNLLDNPTALHVLQSGVLPILSRMVLEDGGGPVSFYEPLQADGAWHLAHVRGRDGEVERIVLNYWTSLSGRSGHTLAGRPSDGAPVVHVGRAYAEHVFTRLLAPPGERRITRLDAPGREPVPPSVWSWRRFEDVDRPASASPLGEGAAPVHFGVAHTDPNQHVNSLVYPRLFEDLAVRVLATLGSGPILSRAAEIVWRKPFFAGESATVALSAWRDEGKLGASGAFVDAEGRERARVVMRFG